MPFEDKLVMGSGPIRKASTDSVKGELAPGYAVAKGELVAIMTSAFALALITDDDYDNNYIGMLIGASTIDTATEASAKTDFRTNLIGAASTAKTADDPDRTLVVFIHPVVELLTDLTAGIAVGSAVKLKADGTAFANPFKWDSATLGTDEHGVVIEQSPMRYPNLQYAIDYKAGDVHQLSALEAPVKVAAVLRTRFN